MPVAISYVVAVDPGYLLLVFSIVCATVPTVLMFAFDTAYSCCMPYKFIVLSSNDSVILYNFMRSRSLAHQGLGVLGVRVFWGEVSWVFGGFTVALRNVLLKFILLSMCFSWLGLQLVVVPVWVHHLIF